MMKYMQHNDLNFSTNVHILPLSTEQITGNVVICKSWKCIQSIDDLFFKHSYKQTFGLRYHNLAAVFSQEIGGDTGAPRIILANE